MKTIENHLSIHANALNLRGKRNKILASNIANAAAGTINNIVNPEILFSNRQSLSEDVISTINCLKKLWVKIKKIKPKKYLIFGNGIGSLFAKKNTLLNFGNSGTLARLLIGILSTTPNITVNLKGDDIPLYRCEKIDENLEIYFNNLQKKIKDELKSK